MKHIKTHIKPSIPILLFSIVLIGVQAYCNLAMPDVMSQIVNVGSQEYSAKIARASGEAAQILMNEQRNYIITSYDKKEPFAATCTLYFLFMINNRPCFTIYLM